jgi:hypothetical protein
MNAIAPRDGEDHELNRHDHPEPRQRHSRNDECCRPPTLPVSGHDDGSHKRSQRPDCQAAPPDHVLPREPTPRGFCHERDHEHRDCSQRNAEETESPLPARPTHDKTHEGSHWGALISWSTAGDISACTLSDDQGSDLRAVPTHAPTPKRYGSYAPSVSSVTLHLHCDGAEEDRSPLVPRPDGPDLQPRLRQAGQSRWLRNGWEARLAYNGGSPYAVNCWLWDNVQRSDFHKRPLLRHHWVWELRSLARQREGDPQMHQRGGRAVHK